MNASLHNRNCFDIIRHIAALAVIVSHHYSLNNMRPPAMPGFIDLGGASVAIFFAISGYLVTQSFDRSPKFSSFIEKRLRRIFPALIVCALMLIYILSPFYQNNKYDYILSGQNLVNAIKLITLLPVEVPNIYSGYKYPSYINGSLWTLPMEFLCYVILALALSLHKTWKTPAILLGLIILIGVTTPEATISTASYYEIHLKWIIKLSLCFVTGSILAMTQSAWSSQKSKLLLFAISALLIIATDGRLEINILGFISISVITIMIGTSFKESIIKGRFDISYGLYIYAFPVQQVISNETSLTFYEGLIVSILTTSLLAYASWTFVEKRFILKPKKPTKLSGQNIADSESRKVEI